MIELAFLGTTHIRNAGEAADAVIVQPRRLALLAFLAASGDTFQRRERLLVLFWGDQPEARARASLRQALYFIRRSLGDDVIISRGANEIRLNNERFAVDVVAFEQAIARGEHEKALASYSGDFLADFHVEDAPEFERWASERRRALRRMAAESAATLADASTDADAAVRLVERAAVLWDYGETDVRRAMRQLARVNARAAALALFERLRKQLGEELGVEPEAATTQLADELRANEGAVVSMSEALPAPTVPALPAERAATAPRPRVRAKAWWAMLAALVATAAGVAWHRSHAVDDPAAAGRVAVFPFAVRDRGEQNGYLREGAATLLSLALDGAGTLRAVDANAVLSAPTPATDLAEGARIARALGAGQYVLGAIDVAGSQLSVAATLYGADGRMRARASARGDAKDLFVLVDTLARQLAVGALTDSSARLGTVAATSTNSLPAFKAFLAGENALRAGRYRDAVSRFQDAVAADSEFGLAYYRLSLAREWTDGEISADSSAALAEHFAAHLPARDRALLAARRAFVRRDAADAERLTTRVLDSYPTDADAWLQLAEARFHLGPNDGHALDDAVAPFLSVLRYRPNDLSARVHLTRIAAHRGDSALVNEWSGGGWRSDASEVGTFELAAMRVAVLGDSVARDTLRAVVHRAAEGTTLAAEWRLEIYAQDPETALWIASLRHPGAVDGRSEWTIGEVARGHVLPKRAEDAARARQRTLLVAHMLSLPSAGELPALARGTRGQLVALLHGTTDDVAAGSSMVALLDARYPALAAVGDAPAVNVSATVGTIVSAMRALGTDCRGAAALVAPGRLDGAVIARENLYDILASIRAESLHCQGRDSAATAWLATVGVNSGGASDAIPFALRRRAELEAAMRSGEASRQHRARFDKIWANRDPELRRDPIARRP